MLAGTQALGKREVDPHPLWVSGHGPWSGVWVETISGSKRRLTMPNLGPTELVIILVIVLLIFGVGKLPEIGSALGKSIRGFRTSVSGVTDLVKGEDEGAQEKKA